MTHYLPMYVGGAACGGILAGIFYIFHEGLFHDDEDDENERSNAAI